MVSDTVFGFFYSERRSLDIRKLVEQFEEWIVPVRNEVDGGVDDPPGVSGREG